MKRRSVLGLLVAAVTGAAMPAPAAASERRGILIQESPLAGFQYHAGQTLWAQFCVDAPLQLLREPDNKYDRGAVARSEEHTSELQSLMRISYAVFCLKKKNKSNIYPINRVNQDIRQQPKTQN